MSAFFLAINRDKSEFDQTTADKMMLAIDDFGHDSHQLQVRGHVAMGYQSLWTVPEEQGERQPIVDKDTGVWCLFHGRIDNRAELFKILHTQSNTPLNESNQSKLSDAALMLQFYLCVGEDQLDRIIGPFAFAIYDDQTGEVFAARDSMGGRHLVYKVTSEHILISTYEMALVAHPSVDYEFNHKRLARIVARLLEDRLSSPIKGLVALEPGQLLTINEAVSSKVSVHTFYCFDGAARIHLADDQAYADRFKLLLDQAVERRSRTIGPVGTMLSGGFDSVPISVLMSKHLDKKNTQLIALSWVFDQHSDVDERFVSQGVCQHLGIEQLCLLCDDVWPQFDHTTYTNPVMPFVVPYVELQQVALNAASVKGVRTVISGVHGDLLYSYTDSILWELFEARRWRDCISEARHRYTQSSGVKSWVKQYLLRPLPWVLRYLERKRLKNNISCDWLNDQMNKELCNQTPRLFEQSLKALRPTAYELVLSGFAGEDIAYGRHIDACHNVERRYPFRDRDLCEFMLSIPSDQLNYKSVSRPIVRRAFSDDLPEAMLARKGKTSFYPAIKAGLLNDMNYMKWFDRKDADWQFYVKKCYFNEFNDKKAGIDIVRWQCGYYDYWKSVCYDKAVTELGLNNE